MTGMAQPKRQQIIAPKRLRSTGMPGPIAALLLVGLCANPAFAMSTHGAAGIAGIDADLLWSRLDTAERNGTLANPLTQEQLKPRPGRGGSTARLSQNRGSLDGTWLTTSGNAIWQNLSGFRAIVFQQETERHAAAPASTSAPSSGQVTTSTMAGPILFQGWQIGRRLVGRSQFFAKGCSKPFTFVVRGWLSPGKDRAVLTGDKPAVVNCKVAPAKNSFPDTIVLNRQ